jgi:hypothetical protein
MGIQIIGILAKKITGQSKARSAELSKTSLTGLEGYTYLATPARAR